jgi:hypothetical protein
MPTPSNTIQFIEFTYCHDKFSNTAHCEKIAKYNPLIHIFITTAWQVNSLITITTSVRGATQEKPIKYLEKLKVHKNEIKTLMKHLHQIAIKYLTYLTLNKRKLYNKQPPIDPPTPPIYSHYILGTAFSYKLMEPISREEGSALTMALGQT